MPHARPEAGVQRDAFSLDHHKILLYFQMERSFSFVGTSSNKLKKFTKCSHSTDYCLVELEDSIARLQACQTKEDVLAMIEESKDSPYLGRIGFGKVRKRNKEMTKRIPNFRIALDHSDLQGAYSSCFVGQK